MCGYSMSTIWTFDGVENKHDIYWGEDCMKKFCVSLREHAMERIKFQKNWMMPLTQNKFKSYLNRRN